MDYEENKTKPKKDELYSKVYTKENLRDVSRWHKLDINISPFTTKRYHLWYIIFYWESILVSSIYSLLFGAQV